MGPGGGGNFLQGSIIEKLLFWFSGKKKRGKCRGGVLHKIRGGGGARKRTIVKKKKSLNSLRGGKVF